MIHIKSKAARAALIAAAACTALIVGVYSLFTYTNVQLLIGDLVRHPGYADGDSVPVFTPDQRLLATLVGSEPDTAVVTLSSVGRTGLRQRHRLRAASPWPSPPTTAWSARPAYGGIAVLWNVAQPRHPARVAAPKACFSNALWGEALSPDSKLLAIAYGGTAALWDVARSDQPRLLDVLDASVGPVMPRDIAFSPGMGAFWSWPAATARPRSGT